MATQEVNELHVEAGPRLNGALLAAGLVDELLVYMAPRLLGTGRDVAAFGPLANLAEAPALRWVDTLPVGEDLRLRAVLAQRDRF
jgi:diaminohydroxyphosphoribosylaminopyrimidine deaminase/5-amino-6-(5-phosphoribosylamino)uracil reductase